MPNNAVNPSANPRPEVSLTAVPRYDDLPQLGSLDVKHSWGVLPASLGTLSFLSPEAVRAAALAVTTGEVLSLNVPFDTFQPPLFGRPSLDHSVIETERNTFEDTINSFNPQSSSQWDGLTHVRAREFGFYSGITDAGEAAATLGIHKWAEHGIVGRGVLVDVARHRARQKFEWDPFSGDVIEATELEQILADQSVTLQPGDVLCVRFGWLAEYRRRVLAGLDVSAVGAQFSGLASTHDTARFAWDHQVAAIAVDNPAVESAPGDPRNGSLHRRMIPGLGFAFAELLDFDALGERCAALNRYDFLFSAAPLPINGATSSTANALAIL